MDRNLGASQAATGSMDFNSYGDLYQWGRKADGHQCRNSGTTTLLSSTDVPSHGLFIKGDGTSTGGNFDWRNPQNDNLWQGVNGINKPCPSGYRIPTSAEFDTERLTWSSNNSAGAYASQLKLPYANGRDGSNGFFGIAGTGSDYWTSTVDGIYSMSLYINNVEAVTRSIWRNSGISVRCIKD